ETTVRCGLSERHATVRPMFLRTSRIAFTCLLVLEASCGAPDDGSQEGVAANMTEVTTAESDPTCGPPPSLDPRAVSTFQTDLVRRLAGAADISDGVRLADRASTSNRMIARDYLSRVFTEIGLSPLRHAYGTGTNVYAELPSTTGGGE